MRPASTHAQQPGSSDTAASTPEPLAALRLLRRLGANTSRVTPALVLFLAVIQTGCLSAFYRREVRFEPLPHDAIAELVPDQSDLTECLQRLGAPLWVWEYQGSGAVLAYGWLESGDWNLSLSIPVTNDTSASFTYRQIDERMRGVVLFFGPDWKLRTMRKGHLRDITAGLGERRPSFEVEP